MHRLFYIILMCFSCTHPFFKNRIGMSKGTVNCLGNMWWVYQKSFHRRWKGKFTHKSLCITWSLTKINLHEMQPFKYVFILHITTYLFIHLFVHLLICLFVHSFIHLFINFISMFQFQLWYDAFHYTEETIMSIVA